MVIPTSYFNQAAEERQRDLLYSLAGELNAQYMSNPIWQQMNAARVAMHQSLSNSGAVGLSDIAQRRTENLSLLNQQMRYESNHNLNLIAARSSATSNSPQKKKFYKKERFDSKYKKKRGDSHVSIVSHYAYC